MSSALKIALQNDFAKKKKKDYNCRKSYIKETRPYKFRTVISEVSSLVVTL